MRPDRRVKSENECRAMVMLLNGGHDFRNARDEPHLRPWWYGSKGHVLTHDVERPVDDPDVPEYGGFIADREYFDADTMEPLTRKQVSKRIQEYDEWMEKEVAKRNGAWT